MSSSEQSTLDCQVQLLVPAAESPSEGYKGSSKRPSIASVSSSSKQSSIVSMSSPSSAPSSSPAFELTDARLVLTLDEEGVLRVKFAHTSAARQLFQLDKSEVVVRPNELRELIANAESDELRSRLGELEARAIRAKQCFTLVVSTAVAVSKSKRHSVAGIDTDATKPSYSLHVLAHSVDEAELLQLALRQLQRKGRSLVSDQLDEWIVVAYKAADKDKNGLLSLKEIVALLESLNFGLSRHNIEQLFRSVDQVRNAIAEKDKAAKKASVHLAISQSEGSDNSLNLAEFRSFCRVLLEMEEIDSLFAKFAGGDCVMDQDEWVAFCQSELEPNARDPRRVQRYRRDFAELVEKERTPSARERRLITLDTFKTMLLSSDYMNIEDKTKTSKAYQSMNHPLSHYWISTSHNTYLMGNQLTGESSIEGYRAAITTGMRCLEIDMTDGDKRGPWISHRFTLCGVIYLDEVLEAINQCAFSERNDYPLMLTLDAGCPVSKPQEQIAVRLFENIFKERLHRTALAAGNKLPTPEQLRGKLIVRFVRKKPPPSESSPMPRGDDFDSIVACAGAHFETLEEAKSQSRPWQSFSMDETKADKLAKADAPAFLALTRERLVRIYPSGLRVASDNLDPVPFWACGVQLAALNAQTRALETDLNDALFRDNGGIGFVLKPDILLDPLLGFNPKGPFNPEWAAILKITVLSGFQVPRAPEQEKDRKVRPYVVVEVRGVSSDSRAYSTATTPTAGGFHPVWNAHFRFGVSVPQLAFLRFEVRDSLNDGAKDADDPVLASHTSRLVCLRSGFGSVPLVSAARTQSEQPRLFVKIDLQLPEAPRVTRL